MPDSELPLSSNSRLAIAGATGQVGGALLDVLKEDRLEIVALTRRPDAASLPEGIAVAAVDFARRETLVTALQGSEQLFLAHGTSGQQVEHEIALIDAAVEAGIRHIVKLSAMGPPTQLNPYAWHMKIEAHLADAPVSATVLRPSPFLDVLKGVGSDVALGTLKGAAGEGKTNFIDTRDVASVARIALLQDGAAKPNRAYHLTGTKAWSMREIAAELSSLLGRSVLYRPRNLNEQRSTLLASGLSPLVADLLTGLDRLFHASALSETTTTVEELTGREPRTLPDWLAENRTVFETTSP